MFNIDRAHEILDEMVQCGHIVDANKSTALSPLLLEKKERR